jgi:hypothetical protein
MRREKNSRIPLKYLLLLLFYACILRARKNRKWKEEMTIKISMFVFPFSISVEIFFVFADSEVNAGKKCAASERHKDSFHSS